MLNVEELADMLAFAEIIHRQGAIGVAFVFRNETRSGIVTSAGSHGFSPRQNVSVLLQTSVGSMFCHEKTDSQREIDNADQTLQDIAELFPLQAVDRLQVNADTGSAVLRLDIAVAD